MDPGGLQGFRPAHRRQEGREAARQPRVTPPGAPSMAADYGQNARIGFHLSSVSSRDELSGSRSEPHRLASFTQISLESCLVAVCPPKVSSLGQMSLHHQSVSFRRHASCCHGPAPFTALWRWIALRKISFLRCGPVPFFYRVCRHQLDNELLDQVLMIYDSRSYRPYHYLAYLLPS
jgi:hypothetical protein